MTATLLPFLLVIFVFILVIVVVVIERVAEDSALRRRILSLRLWLLLLLYLRWNVFYNGRFERRQMAVV